MNNFSSLYNVVKSFGELHNMINEVVLVNSEDELDNREFNYRSMVIMPLEANISRNLNSPVYDIGFGIIIIDKVLSENDEANIQSIEENIFVIGQFQDYLETEGYDAEFGSVDLSNTKMDDYNITTAITDFTFTVARKPYNRGIDI
jgi:hypothetical protein